MTRRSLGAVLAAAIGGACLLLALLSLGIGPDGANARSSGAPIGPKDSGAAVGRAAPEGMDVSVPQSQPVQLAAEEAAPAAPDAPAVESAARPASPPRAGLLQVDTDQPLSIKADELEAIEEPDGRRRLVFSRRVHVDQGGLIVQSDRLEAHYAANASQPDRLVANGNVRVRQKSRELSCARATYFPAQERLECSGNALLRDGANRVNGETIEILFAQDRIRVKGGAVVNVAPDKKKPAPASASAEPPPAGATP